MFLFKLVVDVCITSYCSIIACNILLFTSLLLILYYCIFILVFLLLLVIGGFNVPFPLKHIYSAYPICIDTHMPKRDPIGVGL